MPPTPTKPALARGQTSARQDAVWSERISLLAALLFTPANFIAWIFTGTLMLALQMEATLVELWLHCPLCLALLLVL